MNCSGVFIVMNGEKVQSREFLKDRVDVKEGIVACTKGKGSTICDNKLLEETIQPVTDECGRRRHF
jgi:hypothetical protein